MKIRKSRIFSDLFLYIQDIKNPYCIPEIFKSYTQSYGDATYLNIGQMVSMMYALGGFLFVGMIPLVAYIYYLVSYVSLDIIRAILSLPQKLDELKK